MDYVLTDPNIVKVMYADRQYKQVLGVQYRIELIIHQMAWPTTTNLLTNIFKID